MHKPGPSHVKGTHTNWVCECAIKTVKKDKGLHLYKEHIVVEHSRMQSKKGHWDKGEEKVKAKRLPFFASFVLPAWP
ncbi:hypothetical protein Rhopal_007439-T1 [Rhodotorula paludigena]|uniref:Uncharacterized protein n=1 Tax=Rhodotorula paludigena TaxID=86838 RepID=A0AAV5GWM9_9BASI|nr:hypothetical protein Rhopal_007439-T1 [Rhodotorula paludigena]